jgi:hypothetical protein
MIVPILLAAGAGAGLLTLLLSNRTVGATTPANPAAQPPGSANEQGLADTRVVMGTITLKPSAEAAQTDALDKVKCSDVVVAATDAKGFIVTKAAARPGSTKGECVYSLKVPTGGDLKLGVQDVTLQSSVMMRKAGGEQTIHKVAPAGSDNKVMQKGAQVGNEKAIILQGGLKAAGTGVYIKGSDLVAHKGISQIGPLQRNLNAIFVFEASRSPNKAKT